MNDTATAQIERSEIEGSEIGLGSACGIQILERSAA